MFLNYNFSYAHLIKKFTKTYIMKRSTAKKIEGSTNNYKSKLRSTKNDCVDNENEPKSSTKKYETNTLCKFKAPKRKHLTIEYGASKVPQIQKKSSTKIQEANTNIKKENPLKMVTDVKIKTEPIDYEEADIVSPFWGGIDHIKEELKVEPTEIKQDIKEESYQKEKKQGIKKELLEVKEEKFQNIKKEIKTEQEVINIKQEIKEEIKEESLLDNYVPPFWEEMLNNIREMRKNQDAPVDTMGCDQCPDENASEKIIRYHVLISLMLSPQTKDEVTYNAMARLKSHGLTVDNILNTSEEKLGKIIYPVGFWKTKAKSIRKATEILKNEYDGDIPNTLKDLLKLPGVGPKIAHLCMSSAWNVVTGIGVDTHVHRISNRLAWVNPQTKTPEDTRKALEKWLPKELWSEVNHLMVGFGQTICRPVGPQCSNCLNIDICPYVKINMGIKKNKKLKKMK
ncbi:endonuclease III-like protein 1 [Chrysoperla carnea]|uniref:endonuclease III-like protein 1 n=1 Tax=Chrysoperla carnea TaxID=189513 RepID=UPI001D08F66F|nr:endonuclease III-like protein 1 [Chrysoperla carnea]